MGMKDIHEDIIQTHILTKLDGRSLVAAGCTSSRLKSLCSDHKLWSDICSSNWPSTQDPLVTQTIFNFTSGHRSFFYDAFPTPLHPLMTTISSHDQTTQIISAVDLKYQNQLVVSKVESTNITPSHWFQSSPFRIDLLEPKEIVETGIKVLDDELIQLNLEKHMTLSWILIDPTRNRAVNVSSVKPVSVQRNWLTDELELTFAVVTAVEYDLRDNGHVICNVEITCGVNGDSSELYVSGVSLTVPDIDGKCKNGKDSMVFLKGLMVAERRWCHSGGEWMKERYDEYIQRRKERRKKMEMMERRLDFVRVACVTGFLMAFWWLALY